MMAMAEYDRIILVTSHAQPPGGHVHTRMDCMHIHRQYLITSYLAISYLHSCNTIPCIHQKNIIFCANPELGETVFHKKISSIHHFRGITNHKTVD